MTLPSISFEANLVSDPELRFTPKGVPVCTIRVAVNDRKKDETGKWVNGDSSYFKLNVYREQAENVYESLHKGDTVVVIGRFKATQWEDKEGNKRTTNEIDVDSIGLSMRWESFEKTNTKQTGKSSASMSGQDPWATAPF